ncbi:MAG: hypothetical protein H7X74_08080 [Methyloceanibacter sp.]|nr:hypothetical protein [Methyloceanibacter sp.]
MTDQAGVTLLDPYWPGRPLSMLPGDLSRMVPQGLGLGVPLIVTPYGIGPSPGFYGLDQPSGDPFHGAPTQEPCGGLLYFDDRVELEQLRGALAVIGVHTGRKDFAVFAGQSEDAVAERYLDQVRIISKSGLSHFFDVDQDAKALPDQPIGLGDYVETFIAAQNAKWNQPDRSYGRHLAGTLGGDGDWAKEQLAFGFFVENTSWGVYRLWSRPWLVTK